MPFFFTLMCRCHHNLSLLVMINCYQFNCTLIHSSISFECDTQPRGLSKGKAEVWSIYVVSTRRMTWLSESLQHYNLASWEPAADLSICLFEMDEVLTSSHVQTILTEKQLPAETAEIDGRKEGQRRGGGGVVGKRGMDQGIGNGWGKQGTLDGKSVWDIETGGGWID